MAPVSRLQALAALLAVGVVVATFTSPDTVFLAALVSALVSILAAVTQPTRVEVRSPEWGGEDYEIVEKISEGGMGEVFRARQVELGRFVALKRIQPKRLTQEDKLRFKREARVLSGLSNPHTINVFDAGIQQEDTLFYVMELLDGLNLRQLVEREGTIPPARVIHILRQAANSLSEAHEKELVHRDIKPANLMVCRYGGDFDFVKVLDFGLVKAVTNDLGKEQESVDVITHAGALPGTPAFLAPEAISTNEVKPSADIYALGAIGHFLLTGAHLFEADSPVAMVRAQLHEQAPRASEKSPQDVPAALDDLIAQCLEKNPDDRPLTSDELLHLLEALSAQYPWTRAQAQSCWEDVPAPSVLIESPTALPSEPGIEKAKLTSTAVRAPTLQ